MILRRLLWLWEQRDRRYAVRKSRGGIPLHLTEDEQNALLLQRRREALALPPPDRVKTLDVLDSWVAPRMSV